MRFNKTKLIAEMARQEISNSELAERTGLTSNAISLIRQRGTCRGTTLGAVAKALGVDVTELMQEGG